MLPAPDAPEQRTHFVRPSSSPFSVPVFLPPSPPPSSWARYRGGTENPPTAENVEKGQLFTDRIMSAKAAVAALPNVDATKIAVLGFCFGGTGVYNVFRYDEGDEIQVGISMHGAAKPQPTTTAPAS
eukprot:3934144-Rhodomonas_salina.1